MQYAIFPILATVFFAVMSFRAIWAAAQVERYDDRTPGAVVSAVGAFFCTLAMLAIALVTVIFVAGLMGGGLVEAEAHLALAIGFGPLIPVGLLFAWWGKKAGERARF